MERLRVVAVGAHPDDLEFRVGGTLVKYAAAGADVAALIVTDGDRGSWEVGSPVALGARRQREAEAAMQTLGVTQTIFLHRSDGALYDADGLSHELCGWLRSLQPHVVITHDPWRRYNLHPDHRTVGWACCDAINAARNANFHAEQLDRLRPWRTGELCLFMPFRVNHVVDISAYIETKVAGVLCHGSQLAGWAARAEVEGADLAGAVTGRVLTMAREAAATEPFGYGEAFHQVTFAKRE